MRREALSGSLLARLDLAAILPFEWRAAAWVALGAALLWAVVRAPWRRLLENEQSHVFLGAIVVVAVLWSISGRVGPALTFHLLGASLLCLMFGLPLAVVAMTAVAAAYTATGDGDWGAVAARALAGGALPALVTYLVLRVAERRLPPNFFIYVFVVAFFGSALAALVSGGLVGVMQQVFAPGATSPREDLGAMLILLAFGEATLTGMLAALLAVYQPTWLATFDDARYLKGR